MDLYISLYKWDCRYICMCISLLNKQYFETKGINLFSCTTTNFRVDEKKRKRCGQKVIKK